MQATTRRRLDFTAAMLTFFALVQSISAQSALPSAFFMKIPETVQDLQAIENHVQKLVEKVMPATVCLRVGNHQGSGVIINREGHILTAGHVSGAAERDVTVILSDGRRLRGRTLGANNAIDSGMAVITDKADFPYVEMAKSAALKKGQWCLALGHPGGYKIGRPPVVRLGRLQGVSAKLLVSDCALVGGDSGGPLFDMHGRAIGIHSRIGDKLSANVHVPIDTYRETWTRLAGGEVWGKPLPSLDALKPGEAYVGMRVAPDKKTLKVESVTPDGPAEKAGLRVNDVILNIDNQTLATPEDLGGFLKVRRPGAHINVHVQRGAEIMSIAVVLGKRAS
jgi:serine protease Do